MTTPLHERGPRQGLLPTHTRPRRTRGALLLAAFIAGLAGCAKPTAGPTADRSVEESQAPQTKAPSDQARAEAARNWPLFRGPLGTGVATVSDAPTTWDAASGEGILWKSPIDLPGQSSSIVWEDRVFITGADEHTRALYCFDAHTGERLWRRTPPALEQQHAEELVVPELTGLGAPTPATDGKRVFALFGTGELLCADFEGKHLWHKRFDVSQNRYGHASSPVVYGDVVLLLLDQDDEEGAQSALLALSVKDGREVWRADRQVPSSWSTPIVINAGAREEIITAAAPAVIAYDPADGNELWRADCLGGDVGPSPTFAAGMVFAANVYSNLAAIRPGGSGDVTATHVAWTAQDSLPDTCSPVSDGKLVWILASEGILTCLDAATGEFIWEHEFGMRFLSSPTLVGDRLYLLSETGAAFVIRAGSQFEQLSRSQIGEYTACCPAFVDNRIYIRGDGHLFCIGKATD